MIILPSWLIAEPPKEPLREWGIRIIGDKIVDIAPHASLRQNYPLDETWESPGEVLAPGFVNTHTHLYGLLAHGIPLAKAPSGFWPFLQDFWWPLVENRLDHVMICAATDMRCAQMLQSGVTTFYDCTEAPNALPGILFAQLEVVKRWGLRSILSFEATERMGKENGQLGLRENVELIDACRQSEDKLVSGMMCIHTTFTCSAEFIRQAHTLAADRDVLLHAHVSEGTYEPQYSLQHFGLRPLEYYARLGVAGACFLASQCVQVDEREIDLMARMGVHASHMPLSNCEVGGGIAPIPEMTAAGIELGLGSDGYIDDFFEILRGAFLIHKASHCNPQVMPAGLVWYLATAGGAKALGLENVGRIAPGWQADVQLIDGNLPTPLQAHNIYDQLLLYRNATNVRSVWVAGQLRVRDGVVLNSDWGALNAHVHESAKRLWEVV